MTSLSGKYLSILGASTSTFDGVSNSIAHNSTLGANVAYYPKDFFDDVSKTWWMRVIERLDMKLCVNNSWSGSCVSTVVDGPEKAACMERAHRLHNDTLGIEPDVIILMIGGNDALRGYDVGEYRDASDVFDPREKAYIGDCTKFGQAYATMVHRVKTRYPRATVCACSMLHWNPRKHDKGLLAYNEVIMRIAKEFQLTYVDFYHETDISPETESRYFYTDAKHPNEWGFEQMADCLVRTLTDKTR